MTQLTFTWPSPASYAPEDFIVSAANEEAVRFLGSWPDGHSAAALLTGPQASGKTHLARNWAERVHAAFIDKAALGGKDSAALWHGTRHAVLEDIHDISDETALFHLLRHAEAHGLFLLLSARETARNLSFRLPDLRSRLLALPATFIDAPDEELLKIFLFKSFADRQLRVGDGVIDYLLKRMERSFSAALALVERLEAKALSDGRKITVSSLRTVIG